MTKRSQNCWRLFRFVNLILLASLSLLSTGCGLESNGNAARLDKIALEYEQSGPSAILIAKYKSYLEEYPKDSLAWTLLGHAHQDLEENDAANECYDKAIELDPNRVDAITGKGVLLRSEDKFDEALAMYERAVKIDPTYAQAYASMLVIAILREDHKKAVEYGERAYSLDREDPVIAANLSVAYHHVGDIPNRDKFHKIAAKLGYKNLEWMNNFYAEDGVLSQ